MDVPPLIYEAHSKLSGTSVKFLDFVKNNQITTFKEKTMTPGKEEIKEIQKKLSKVNKNFLKFAEKNPGALHRSNFKSLELNDKLFTLQPWPTFINPETKKAFQEAGVKLFNLVKNIPQRVFNNDPQTMNRYYHVPVNLLKIQMEGVTDSHLANLVGRGDFILSSSGLKCLEYNVTPSLGGWQISIWESLYLSVPILNRFLKEYGVKVKNQNMLSLFLEHVLDSSLPKLSRGEAELNIALVMKGFVEGVKNPNWMHSTGKYLNKLYKQVLQGMDQALTGDFIVCDYPHLHLVDNCIFYNEKRIHAVVEGYNGVISSDVMKAFKANNIHLNNGPITDVLSNKLNLAILSDPTTNSVFTDEEKKIIDAYIPWTRKLSPGSTTYGKEKVNDLIHFVRVNREKLVIKPGLGYGGKGIYIGNKTPQYQWENVIGTAVKEKSWLVQELVSSPPGLYQVGEADYDLQDMVWGFFIFGSRYAGAWNRVMPQKSNKGVVNCHQGATVSVIFEVDE